jgi:hypothetical protein
MNSCSIGASNSRSRQHSEGVGGRRLQHSLFSTPERHGPGAEPFASLEQG